MKITKVTYVRTILKGDLHYADLLIVDKEKKTCLYVDEKAIETADLLHMTKLTYNKFEKKYFALSKAGYKMSSRDGAEVRIPYSECKEALALLCPMEKLIAMLSVRPSRGDYYSYETVKFALEKFKSGEIDLFYLKHWVNFYAYCLQESFSKTKNSIDTLTYAVIKTLFNFIALAKSSLDQEERDKIAHESEEAILLLDEKRKKLFEPKKKEKE